MPGPGSMSEVGTLWLDLIKGGSFRVVVFMQTAWLYQSLNCVFLWLFVRKILQATHSALPMVKYPNKALTPGWLGQSWRLIFKPRREPCKLGKKKRVDVHGPLGWHHLWQFGPTGQIHCSIPWQGHTGSTLHRHLFYHSQVLSQFYGHTYCCLTRGIVLRYRKWWQWERRGSWECWGVGQGGEYFRRTDRRGGWEGSKTDGTLWDQQWILLNCHWVLPLE